MSNGCSILIKILMEETEAQEESNDRVIYQ